ncbi:hypothetical protein IQ241_22565 [Romeria aff. gracilis LEGE 07310]|uniref:Uncharacterized protein n=1 Tax=Vasconcelosia minhoensis LEGE 07310 TaxID=915328 RepID=A0A8J7AJD5_9CYAN|nr:hypothetical protein [Romeria gracilis]MBE9080039.1 hypothetical protein [Romeria aff. gracilis LEGE 07310]
MTDQPNIVHLNLLDTDYAKLLAGEAIPEERKRRLDSASAHTFEYLGKQIARYRYDNLDQEGKDDILCKIGVTAELLTRSDIEDMHDRMMITGHFYLTDGERQQIFNWLEDELAIQLKALDD